MKTALLQEPIGSAAARHRELRRLFEALGLDYYCEGQLTIEEACRGAAVEPGAIGPMVAEAAGRDAGANWLDAPLATVISYLQGEHHAVTRGGLFRIGMLFTEACRASSDEGLATMRAEFRHLAEKLIPHMEREELTLFPAIVALEEAWTRGESPAARFEGGLRALIGKLVVEHNEICRRLTALRNVRERIGEDKRASLARVFNELQRLERHIHEYMNLESYVVFPRAVALEDALTEKALQAV